MSEPAGRTIRVVDEAHQGLLGGASMPAGTPRARERSASPGLRHGSIQMPESDRSRRPLSARWGSDRPSRHRCRKCRRYCWNGLRRHPPAARSAAKIRRKAEDRGCGGRRRRAAPRFLRHPRRSHGRSSTGGWSGETGLARWRRESPEWRSMPQRRRGGASEIPVDLDEKSVGGRRVCRPAADQVRAHIQVRNDEPGSAAP